MNTDIDEAGPALGRIRAGVDQGITRRRRRRTALVAGGVVIAAAAGIGAGLAWPDAQDSAYIVCIDSRVDGAFSTGGGFSMVDPIGFCLDYGDYRDPAGWTFDWGVDYNRSELVACRLADGIAGVFVRADGDCAANNARDWTSADVLIADQITDEWREWHIATFGEDPQPTIVRTPSQLVAP